MTSRLAHVALTTLMLAGAASLAPPAAAQSHVDRVHAGALDSFRVGRFPEAYGRFVGLAEMGHPASARYALWMCEHGLELFGKDFDCAPHQVEDWARAAGVPAPVIGPRYYGAPTAPGRMARR